MAFPDFRDFLAQLTQEQVTGIMGDAQNASKLMENIDFLNPDDLGPAQVQAISFQTALGLLALYHTWLEKEL